MCIRDSTTAIVDVDAAKMAFSEQLVGVRSYGCIPGEPGQFTTEFVEVYTDSFSTFDTWLYEEPDCVTRPLSFNATLSLSSYTLESPFLTSEGREAFTVTTELLQDSTEGTGFSVGTTLFDLIAVEQGGVTVGVTFAETEDCLLYTSPSPRDATLSRMPSSA